jgi:hypothetical protein
MDGGGVSLKRVGHKMGGSTQVGWRIAGRDYTRMGLVTLFQRAGEVSSILTDGSAVAIAIRPGPLVKGNGVCIDPALSACVAGSRLPINPGIQFT